MAQLRYIEDVVTLAYDESSVQRLRPVRRGLPASGLRDGRRTAPRSSTAAPASSAARARSTA